MMRDRSLHSLAVAAAALVSLLLAPAGAMNAVAPFATPTLSAAPAVLAASGDTVTLTWSGVSEPFGDDIITVSTVPAAGSQSVQAMIGWLNVSWADGWESGAGRLSLPLVNMRRTSYSFAYVQPSASSTPLASSAAVKFQNVSEPTGLHLALGASAGEMTVSWISDSSAVQAVRFAAAADWPKGATVAPSAVQSYAMSDMCGPPANTSDAWLDPGALHTATMTGLKAGGEYTYSVGSAAAGWSAPVTLVAPPDVGADVPTSMLIFGDLGVDLPFTTTVEQQAPSRQTVNWLAEELRANPQQMVMLTGDVSYARGWGFIWDWFFNQVEPVASKVAWHVGIGNHEFDWPTQSFKPSWGNFGTDSGGECGVPYFRRFTMATPSAQADGGANLWYSFDFGAIHTTVFSTEHDFTPDSAQYKWLAADLAAVDRTRTPWVIVTGHRPAYSSSAGHYVGNGALYDKGLQDSYMRLYLEPLLVRHNVTLAMWGHVHKYERTCGVVNFTCADTDSEAPVHIVMGNAGNVFQTPWEPYNPKSGPTLQNAGHTQQPDWSMFRTANFGYTRVRTTPASADGTTRASLTLELVGDQREQVHDSVTLYRD